MCFTFRWLYEKFGKILNRLFLFGFGFQWIKRKGQQLPPSEVPVMIISPHSSVFDMFLGALNHLPFLVARAENRHLPVLGRKFMGLCIYITFIGFKCIPSPIDP